MMINNDDKKELLVFAYIFIALSLITFAYVWLANSGEEDEFVQQDNSYIRSITLDQERIIDAYIAKQIKESRKLSGFIRDYNRDADDVRIAFKIWVDRNGDRISWNDGKLTVNWSLGEIKDVSLSGGGMDKYSEEYLRCMTLEEKGEYQARKERYEKQNVAKETSQTNEIDKIIKAKNMVRSIANYPDTVRFHFLHTKVDGNIVTLKFTAKNGFGVPETQTLEVDVGY